MGETQTSHSGLAGRLVWCWCSFLRTCLPPVRGAYDCSNFGLRRAAAGFTTHPGPWDAGMWAAVWQDDGFYGTVLWLLLIVLHGTAVSLCVLSHIIVLHVRVTHIKAKSSIFDHSFVLNMVMDILHAIPHWATTSFNDLVKWRVSLYKYVSNSVSPRTEGTTQLACSRQRY